MDEIVGLYDAEGRECGSAPRSRVRAENLRHAASSIVVDDGAGRVFVHRRTTTKDVFPGLRDFAAGGVLGAGEDPDEGAARELAEELGITGTRLTKVGEDDYADEHTDYRAFLYTATWDGSVRLQPEEVSWGDWMPLAQLLAEINAAASDFVPDSVALWRDRLADEIMPGPAGGPGWSG